MAIARLTIPVRTAASSTGYAEDMNLVIAKLNELATAMAISPLTIAAAVGAGNPAADMNQVVAKINELIGGTTPPAGTKATKPVFGTIDDTNNVVGLTSDYSYTEVMWGVEGGSAQQLGSNSICSPGNIAGRLFAYVVANSAAGRLQSDTEYSAPFTLATTTTNTKPTASLSVAGGTTTVTTGQSVTLQLSGADADAGDSITKVEAFDNGVKIGEVTGASGSLQTVGLTAGTHSFTARATDSHGATGLSVAVVVTAAAPGVTTLTPPSGLRQTGSTLTTIGLAWTGVANASGYEVQRDALGVYSGTSTTFTDSGLASDTSYAYRVRTLGTGSYGNSAWSAPLTAATQSSQTAPRIDSFSPSAGVPGILVTLGGAFFTPSTTVMLGSIAAIVESVSADGGQLQFRIPSGAGTGQFTVANGTASTQSAGTFTVQSYEVSPTNLYQTGDRLEDRASAPAYTPATAWQPANAPRYYGGDALFLPPGTAGMMELYFQSPAFAIDLPQFNLAQYVEMQVDGGARVPLGIPAGPDTSSSQKYISGYLGTAIKRLRLYGVAAANAYAIVDSIRFVDAAASATSFYTAPGYAEPGYVI